MKSITNDLLAGVLVGVVLVPTAMAFGVIAGLGPAAGLYGAIALGFLAAITGNTRGLISGPNILRCDCPGVGGIRARAGGWLYSCAPIRWFSDGLRVDPIGAVHRLHPPLAAVRVLHRRRHSPGRHPGSSPSHRSAPSAGGVAGSVKAWTSATVDFDALAIAGITVAVGVFWPTRLAKYASGQFVALLAGSIAGIIWFTGAPVIGESREACQR